ncbi:hypothetical protein DS834_01835 [Lactobacillus bombicola]|uniref:Uncharacterized protein n=1 Tax=Lactobacillus bombicola TaxID=1505723 RepID=A0ABX9LW20_9LACO|nr:hypothetical protein DS834_01835 [Lactobacillus bombicola]
MKCRISINLSLINVEVVATIVNRFCFYCGLFLFSFFFFSLLFCLFFFFLFIYFQRNVIKIFTLINVLF